MGVFDMGDANLDLLMAQDEEIAEQLDRNASRRRRRRVAEVEEAIADGGERG